MTTLTSALREPIAAPTVLTVDTIDVHAEGGPSRVVVSAAALVQGDTMAERLAYCRANLNGLRRMLLHEPRGYPALCAVMVLPAVEPGSDFGIIVLEQGGFTPMSGSNVMAAVTAVLESGIVPAVEPVTEITIDTAVGAIRARASVSGGKVTSVTVVNVPAFVVELDASLEIPGYGSVPVDIVFGGQFYALAKASDFGLSLHPSHAKELAKVGALIKLAAAEQVRVQHPENPDINSVALVLLHSGDPVPGERAKNTVVQTNGALLREDPTTWTGALTRDPGGTGTSARMAAMFARGQIGLDQEFPHQSIIGSEFVGRLTGTTTVGDHAAVLPTISGQSWVTGRSQWVIGATDPFPEGYTVGDIWGPQA